MPVKPKLPIYLDYHATTPVDPKVLEAMLPYFQSRFGNASSSNHSFGAQAEKAVEIARAQVASLIGCEPKEIVFTSGGTESDNLAIKGAARAYRERGNHLITVQTEHKAVLDSCKSLENEGFEISYLPVDREGHIDLASLKKAFTSKTILVSVMAANNEIGTLAPLKEIARLTREREILFHTDAAQAVGKILLDVQGIGIDLLTISGHKIYAPKGVGALYVRRKNPRVRLLPLLDGGGQEGGLRSGTLNVPGIVGLGKACEIYKQDLATESKRVLKLREQLWEGLRSQLSEVKLNGPGEERLPGNLNLSFGYVDGEALQQSLTDIAVSAGSACHTQEVQPSHVLTAIGVNPHLARATIRFGLGRFTTSAEVDFTVAHVVQSVNRLRAMSPDWPGEGLRRAHGKRAH